MRPLLALIAIAVLAGAAPAPAGSDPDGDASARFKARLTASTHTPRANRPWRWKVTVRRNGRPLRATLTPQFVYQGLVVRSLEPRKMKGTYRKTYDWPKRSVGYPLTFRAHVKTRYGTRNLDWWIRVKR